MLRWLLALTVLLILITGAYSTYLAQIVRVKFEGKRWAEPARVYARPLELYVGATLTTEQLQYELKLLGYRKVRHPKSAAQWSRNRNRFLIHTRTFSFWDGEAQAKRLDIHISQGRVSELEDSRSGHSIDLVRIEPAIIGSIYPAHKEDRVLVRRDDLPDSLVQALLAIEDRRYFQHHGVDPKGIARALWANLVAGRTVQGGSTLTQQLVKNFLLTSERSLSRKVNEALMALIVDARYDKDEILEAYANEIFLGQDGARAIHGFGLASLYYFKRPLQELRLHEAALLVGLVKGASYYNPRRHPKRAKQRRDLVLEQMYSQGYIDKTRLSKTKKLALGVVRRGARNAHRYPAFIKLVRRQLGRDYREEDLTSEGLRIFTTLDPWDQQQAAKAMSGQLQRIEKTRRLKKGSLQGAMVVASPQGGEILALLGGRDAGYAGFNRALDAVRPIGSLVKPAVYLTALTQADKYSLVSMLRDEAVTLRRPTGEDWQPHNYGRKAHGPVPLHSALAKSLNLATVNLGLDLGLDAVIDTLQELGVSRKMEPFPSLLLGALSLSPLEVAQVYQTLAAGGFRAPLRAIREVLDVQQQPLQRYPLTVSQAAKPAPVYLLSRNLVEVTRQGTAKGLKHYLGADFEAAGKTGTTNDLRDAWFAGFTADRVAVVWVGRDDNAPTGLTGSSGAVPVWGDFMRSVKSLPLSALAPDAIEYFWIDNSGRLSAEGCTGAQAFPFIKGSEPQMRSSCALEQEPDGFFQRLFQ